MKKLVAIFMSFLILACSSEDANDCFQTSGKIIQEEVSIVAFTKILVNRDVELILKEGADTKVIIETGENLINDVTVEVVGNQLQLTDNNTCNFVRDYGITRVYVTAPNITELRNSSQFEISSQGILNYNSLRLISEDFIEEDAFAVGDFNLQISATSLEIISNRSSMYMISGNVENLKVGFYAGSGRFEGANLVAQHVDVFHRGSNDMIVNPQQSLTGELRSTGNLISLNQPSLIDVEQFYTGQLIFED